MRDNFGHVPNYACPPFRLLDVVVLLVLTQEKV